VRLHRGGELLHHPAVLPFGQFVLDIYAFAQYLGSSGGIVPDFVSAFSLSADLAAPIYTAVAFSIAIPVSPAIPDRDRFFALRPFLPLHSLQHRRARLSRTPGNTSLPALSVGATERWILTLRGMGDHGARSSVTPARRGSL
jgi:hypothetical protein